MPKNPNKSPTPYFAEGCSQSPNPNPAPPPSPQDGHSGTFGDEELPVNLTDIQVRAIELTVQGFSDTQVADQLSLNRKTLWRWKTYDEDYRTALHDARMQLHSGVTDRYRTFLLRATSVLAKFLEDDEQEKRFRTAYALLTMAGCFKPIPPKQLTPTNHPMQEDPHPMPMPDLESKVG